MGIFRGRGFFGDGDLFSWDGDFPPKSHLCSITNKVFISGSYRDAAVCHRGDEKAVFPSGAYAEEGEYQLWPTHERHLAHSKIPVLATQDDKVHLNRCFSFLAVTKTDDNF